MTVAKDFTKAGHNKDFPAGAGEMSRLIRELDWSKTPLGPIESWSQSLRMMVSFLLSNRFPLLLWWGPDYIQIYNDAYRPVLGSKHPWALGLPTSQCWSEIWHVIGPLIDTPFRGGPATWMDDLSLEINRHGFFEETHFTVAYSPVPDETVASSIGGVLATVHEITEKVIGERRVEVLRDLGSLDAKSPEEACAIAARTLAKHPKDVPFALLYLIAGDKQHACLAGTTGIEEGGRLTPQVMDLTEPSEFQAWPLAEVVVTETMQVVQNLAGRFGNAVPHGPWTDPPNQAVIVPIRSNIAHQLAGFLVAGISSRLKFDDSYLSFVELAASQIATAVASARAYEEERKRAEALAELDRAKTAFFSNVSHEFRTPLTLMLGPIEELLSESHTVLSSTTKDQLELVNRNGHRLLRLVNTLLDFSRIEAGRTQASYEPTDLSAFTAELASVFRAATERAGLRLIVDCPPLSEAVYIDREMWEKIVLNLISNAFKFTFEGEIAVSLREQSGPATSRAVELRVRDTGVGVAAEDMPRLFERFHRIETAHSRTHEGTGIGLALVQELVKLHGGVVRVESVLDQGSMFVVSVPFGTAHLPPDRIGAERALSSTATRAAPFVEEALRWLPDDANASVPGSNVQSSMLPEGYREPEVAGSPQSNIQDPRSKILVADDNADMRHYLTRLLSERYKVEAVADGEAALAALAKRRPDILISDVMMPRMDGIELLKRIRGDAATRTIPVILLSARAGEESRVEGFDVGADDYLIKPFNARELLARVESHIKLSRVRQEIEATLEEADRRKDNFLAILGHELRNPLGVISTVVQLMQKKISGDVEAQELRDTAERQVKQMARLLDDLLDISRIARGQIRIKQEPCNLTMLVKQTIEDHRILLEESGLTLSAEIPELPLWVNGDNARISQIIGNALMNACKFTDSGGRVTVRLLKANATEAAILTVRDTGIGMQAEMLRHAFEPFVQDQKSIGRSRGGLGLGLALIKGLVELHKGKVTIESDGPGRGTQLTVSLPLAQAHVETPRSIEQKPPTVRSYRILLVEDNQLAAKSTKTYLSQSGHTVEAVHSGLIGIAAAKRFKAEVILCDLGLPGLDGYEVARSMRLDPELKKVYLIAVTGYGQEEDKRRSAEAGFNAHLTKPLDFEKLEQLLKSLPSDDSALAG